MEELFKQGAISLPKDEVEEIRQRHVDDLRKQIEEQRNAATKKTST